MPRVTPQPLQNAAPTLQPTARPIAIRPGATPPAHSSLMELANAFQGFNGELRDLLRDSAAREERDAMAMGELEATRTHAAKRMGEIETTIKKAVDAGTVSHVRLPAFERGFRMRAGKDLAALFQEKLTAKLSETTRVDDRLDPEQAIADTYEEVAGSIHQDDLYARAGFDGAAQGVIAAFRQRSAEGYTAAYKATGEQKMADEGSELALQLSTAPEDEVEGYRAAVKANLDELRKELPVSRVNEFYLKRVVAPAVEKLSSTGKHTEANRLLDEMEHLDVTGKGGLLGQTSVGKTIISDLRNTVDRESRTALYDDLARIKKRDETSQIAGEDDAIAALQKLKGDKGTLPQEERFQLIADYRKANAADPRKVASYEQAVNSEYEQEDAWHADPRKTAELEASLDTLDTDTLDAKSNQLEALWNLHMVKPTDYGRMKEFIAKRKALYGAISPADFKQFTKDLYFARHDNLGNYFPDFGDPPTGDPAQVSASDTWFKLSPDQQANHEKAVTEFFSQKLHAGIRAIGDPNRVPAEKAGVVKEATVEARDYARRLLVDMVRDQQKKAQQQRVQKQAQAVRDAKLVRGFGVIPHLGNYRAPGTKFVQGAVPEGQHGPAPLADVATVYIPATTIREWVLPGMAGKANTVDLTAIAKDIVEDPDPAKAAKSKELYGYVKSRLGFTPDEISKAVTRHGVSFDPSAVDPRYIAVFESRDQLEKAWNKGKPTDLFYQVGDAIDPQDKLTPAELYLAQLAVFSK